VGLIEGDDVGGPGDEGGGHGEKGVD
jgi:hypothetical protein